MKFSDLLLYNPSFAEFLQKDDDDFARIYNLAYLHVRERLSLYPKFFKCVFAGGVNLNVPIAYGSDGASTGARVQFKQITEIIGQTISEDVPDDLGIDNNAYVIMGSTANTGLSSERELFFSHNYVHTLDGNPAAIPMVGHLFPCSIYSVINEVQLPFVEFSVPYHGMQTDISQVFLNYYVPDTIVFPLTAKIHALMALENDNVSLAGAYDTLCNHYINMRNAGLIHTAPKELTTPFSVTPYALL